MPGAIVSLRYFYEEMPELQVIGAGSLIACQSPYTKAEIWYWGRRAKSSTAEIDYLIEKDGKVIPIEVKSGSTGGMKSLNMFIETKQAELALKISQAKFQPGKPITSLPFYGIEGFLRLGELHNSLISVL